LPVSDKLLVSGGDTLRSVENREVSLPLGIVVEKRKSNHPWASWSWKPMAVFMNPPKTANWHVMEEGEDYTLFHANTLLLNLHRRETEALRLNLMLDAPELYVVLRENEDTGSDFPYQPFLVTASSYDAQDFEDVGDDIIEKVAMPEALAAFIQAFIEEHHIEEEFKKRRRDKLDIEEKKFGKSPIFQSHIKH